MTATLYIDGIIWDEQSDWAPDWGIFSLRTARNFFRDNVDEDTTEVVIVLHSPGGMVWEGFAIHDFLVEESKRRGIKLTTRVNGFCGSIATVIALAAKPENRFMTENSTFYIHPPQGWVGGDADEIEKYLKEMRQEESRIISFYHDKTGALKEDIEALMKPEEFLTSQQAVDKGFFQEDNIINTNKINFFKRNHPISNTMDNESKSLLKMMSETLTNLSKKLDPTTNSLTLTDSAGSKVEFDTDNDTYAEGDEVKVDGKTPNDGDIIMTNGDVLKIVGGKVDSITLNSDELTAMKKENNALTNQITDLTNKNKELTNKLKEFDGIPEQLKEMQATITKLNALSSNHEPPTGEGEDFSSKNINSKGKTDRVAAYNNKKSQEKTK